MVEELEDIKNWTFSDPIKDPVSDRSNSENDFKTLSRLLQDDSPTLGPHRFDESLLTELADRSPSEE